MFPVSPDPVHSFSSSRYYKATNTSLPRGWPGSHHFCFQPQLSQDHPARAPYPSPFLKQDPRLPGPSLACSPTFTKYSDN